MPRKPRLFSPFCAYHILARGNNRQTLFRRPDDFRLYLDFLKKLKKEYAFELFHYCLMTNHVHLLMRFGDLTAFRKTPQRLNLLYAKHVHRAYAHVGHVFQDRFKSLPVTENSYLLECGRYIERNPVKAGMVHNPEDYPWSSHAVYLGRRKESLITPNPLFIDLASTDLERKRVYRSFVSTNRAYDGAMEAAIFGQSAF